MPNTVKVLKLTTDEKNSLECLLRCPTTEARKYIRAKILLLKSDSYTNEAIADKLDITVPTVRLCLQKYFAGGIDNALNDCKGKGRKQEISDDDITWVVNKACQKPQIKPNKKPVQPKKTETDKKVTPASKPAAKPNKNAVRSANPLQSLMNSVDDLQKQIGEEDAPAQVPYDEPVNNLGIEGGNSQGSYFSELSVSGIDFVKSKIQESWKTIAGGKDDRNIEVVISVKLTKEGLIESVKIEDMRRYRTDTYFQALADSAERAIYIAQDVYGVFKVLSAQSGSRYSDWKEIRFTFTPLGLSK